MDLSFIEKALIKQKAKGLYRSLKPFDTTLKIDFLSNDYLGLAQSKEIYNKTLNKMEELNTSLLNGSSGSRLLSGHHPLFDQLENQLAKISNTESALLFNSGYTANLAVLSCIPQKNDLVLYDELSHACIKDGIRLSLAKFHSFKHNDLDDLKRKIDAFNGRIFVVVESIYSMDGDQAPLQELSELCRHYHANLIVDEAHSTGIYGKKGEGLVSELGLDELIFCKILTFGKAIGAHGAAVCCNQLVKDYLINFARPFIYTTAMPVHSLLSISSAFDYLENHLFKLKKRLHSNIELFTKQLNKQVKLSSSNIHPIQSLLIGDINKAVQLSKLLNESGFDVRPIVAPTVKEGSERIRICIHAFNTEEQLLSLCAHINKLV